MNSIEGIPEGWELVRVGKPVINVDCVVAEDGMPVLIDWVTDRRNWLIIRKIEKPPQYRAFENGAEAMLSWDAKVRRKADGSGIFRVVAIGETTVGIGFSLFSFQDAFKCYECDDGTPFGVEVTS